MLFTMKLQQYLKKKKISKTKFAQTANITRQTLYTLLAGGKPSYRTIRFIEKATNKQVQYNDF